MTKRGQAKVLDFGLAKPVPKVLASADAGLGDETSDFNSIVGIISGTPSYMSPEQVRGDELDPRTDIFSLGLVLTKWRQDARRLLATRAARLSRLS